MRVVQLTQRFPPALGGVESHVCNLAVGLTKSGVGIEVFTTDLEKDVPFTRLNGGELLFPFSVRRFHASKYIDVPHGLGILAPSMLLALLETSPDLIHAHAFGYFPMIAGGLAEMMRGVPLVVTPHCDVGGATLAKRLLNWAMPAVTLRRAQRVIALTTGEAYLLVQLGVARERIRVIPNGVDLREFPPSPAPRSSSEDVTVLFVGRCYSRQKGLEYLIRAIALLAPMRKPCLRIVGEDWGGVSELQALSRSLGIEQQLEFTGRVSRADVIQAYASADVFVLPSLFEPFGIVLLEAMAAGLPIVASRVGGIPDVVEDGKTGILVEPRNAQALSRAIEILITDAPLRNRMGEEGRRRAATYSWDEVVPRIREVYEEAIEERDDSRAG